MNICHVTLTIVGGPVGVSVGVTGIFCKGDENVYCWLEESCAGLTENWGEDFGMLKLKAGMSLTGSVKSVRSWGISKGWKNKLDY